MFSKINSTLSELRYFLRTKGAIFTMTFDPRISGPAGPGGGVTRGRVCVCVCVYETGNGGC